MKLGLYGKEKREKGKDIENNSLFLNNNINIYFNFSMNCIKIVISYFFFLKNSLRELKYI